MNRWLRHLAVRSALVLALALPIVDVEGQNLKAGEYELKAVYVVKFLDYVTWPTGSNDRLKPVTICVLGSDPFDVALHRAARAKVINGRRLDVSHRTKESDTDGCNVVFMAGPQSRVPDQLDGRPVLTIGEGVEFARRGGMIALVVEGSALRFAINRRKTEASRLRISSHLLRLAKMVDEEAERK